jgi:hypothetical protein
MAADPRTGALGFAGRPGARWTCSPVIILDGERYKNRYAGRPIEIDDVAAVWEIRVIEIYQEALFTPAELGLKHTNQACA